MADNDVAATPVATPASVSTETVEAPKPSGTTPGEIKQSGRANAHALGQKYEAAAKAAREHHSQTQPRDEAGKFAEGAAAPAAEPSEVLGGSATAEATATTPAAQGPPEGMVRIEYPEGHPLRAQGETFIDVPANFERAARTMVNSAARRAEAETATRQAQEARAAQMRAEAALRFYQENGNTFWTPEDQALYDDIVASYSPTLGPEAAKARAEAFKRGREVEARQQLGKVAESADLAAITEHWTTEGGRFKSEAHVELPKQFPGIAPHEIDQAITMYALEIQRLQDRAWSQAQHQMSRAEFERRFAQEVGYKAEDFFAVAGDYLKTRPGVIAASGQTKAAQELRERQIRAEAEAAERERRIEAAQRHSTNPQRALGGVATGQRTTDTTEQPPDRTKMSASEIRQAGRNAARELGERFGQALRR